jgi:hypothetical protein
MSMNGTATVRVRSDQPSMAGLAPLLSRLRNEYDEMPGLCLTPRQAQRLCGLEQEACHHALAMLVEAGYLRSTPRGYVRA